jgi:hypothetical protein
MAAGADPLSRAQLRRFYEDGYIILPLAVAAEIVGAARAALDGADTADEEKQAALARCYNEGQLRAAAMQLAGGDILRPIAGGQAATRPPEGPGSTRTEESGYQKGVVPWFNWTGHLDGLWSG